MDQWKAFDCNISKIILFRYLALFLTCTWVQLDKLYIETCFEDAYNVLRITFNKLEDICIWGFLLVIFPFYFIHASVRLTNMFIYWRIYVVMHLATHTGWPQILQSQRRQQQRNDLIYYLCCSKIAVFEFSHH